MNNLFNMLNAAAKTSATRTSGGSFGDLVDKETYTFEVTGVKAGPNKNGDPMLTLDTKTVSGDKGVGTKVKAFYMLTTDKDGALNKPWQSTVLMQLAGALDVSLDDIIADDWFGYMNEIATRIKELDAPKFKADVKYNGEREWNGTMYKQWGINAFSITPAEGFVVDHKPAEEVTTTDATKVAEEFNFDLD